jgi:hypothetical protein
MQCSWDCSPVSVNCSAECWPHAWTCNSRYGRCSSSNAHKCERAAWLTRAWQSCGSCACDDCLGWCPQLVGWLAGCPHFHAAPQVLQCGPVRLRGGEADGHRRPHGSRGAGGGPAAIRYKDRRCPPVCCQRYAPCTALLYCPLVLASCTALLYCPLVLPSCPCTALLSCPLVLPSCPCTALTCCTVLLPCAARLSCAAVRLVLPLCQQLLAAVGEGMASYRNLCSLKRVQCVVQPALLH